MKKKMKTFKYEIQMKDKIYGLVIEPHKDKKMLIVPFKPETYSQFLNNIRSIK